MILEEIENEIITPVKECFPYIEMRDNRNGTTFFIDWSEKIAELIYEN